MSKFTETILIFLLFLLVIVSATFEINDPDTVQYLAAGKHIVENGFARTTVFSYTIPDYPLLWPEWLFEVITYFVYSIGKWNGLVVFQIFLVLSIFFVLFKICCQQKYKFLSISIFFFFAAAVAVERFMLRSELVGFLLSVIFIYILNLFQQKETKVNPHTKTSFSVGVYLLPFLQIIWVNNHGSFPLGFIIISAFLFADFFRGLWRKYILNQSQIIFSGKIILLGTILIVSIFVSLFNPDGIKGLLWPFEMMSKNMSFLSQQNLEFQSPFKASDFEKTAVIFYKILIWISLLLLLANGFKMKLEHLFLFIPLFYLSVQSIRNIALFSIISAVILPGYLDNLMANLNNLIIKKNRIGEKIKKYGKTLVIVVLSLAVLKIIVDTISNKIYIRDQRSRRFGFGVTELIYPEQAAQFIEKNNIQGNGFNDYGNGTYLNWRLFSSKPANERKRTFISGHTFSPELFRYYNRIMDGTIPYKEVIEKYQINYFLINHILPNTTKLIRLLYQDEEWSLIYFDELSVIFVSKNNPANQEIIEKYSVDFQTNKNFDPENLKSIKKKFDFSAGRSSRGAFLANVGLWSKAVFEFEKAAEEDYRNYIAWRNLGVTYAQLSQVEKAIEAYKKSIKIMPKYAPSHFDLAFLYEQKNMLGEAAKEYKKVLKINKIYPGALDALEKLQTNPPAGGQKPENIDELNDLIKQNPNDADLYLRLGVVHGQKNQIDQAIDNLKKAAELNPNLAMAHFNLGNAYSVKNMIDEAVLEYEKTIALDPRYGPAYLNLGVIYRYQKSDIPKTIEYWQKYIELEPNDPQTETIKKEIQQIVLQEMKK